MKTLVPPRMVEELAAIHSGGASVRAGAFNLNPKKQMKTKLKQLAVGAIVTLGFTTVTQAQYSAVAPDFQTEVRYSGVSPQGGFTAYQGQIHSWANLGWGSPTGYYIDNTLISQAALDGNGFGDPFGLYDPVTSTFYAGTYAGAGTGLWRYNNDNSWTKLGVFDSLYGADTFQGRVYASGLNTIWNGSSGQDNVIALYDLTGGSQHDVLIQATGNSASVAVDKFGNVYYANYGNLDGTISGLRVWTAEQIDSVRADLGNGAAGGGELDYYLTYDDSCFLTELPGGANGITVDDAGNVFVSVNGTVSGILMWNSLLGTWSADDPNHYTLIADMGGGWGWAGFLDAEGNVLDGGTLYAGSTMMSDDMTLITYNGDPVTPPILDILQPSSVPEPSTWALILTGGTLFGLIGRRRNNR